MAYTQAQIVTKVNTFKVGIDKRNPHEFQKLRTVTDPTSIDAAVTLAYNDAKRTLEGIGKVALQRDKALAELKENLALYFTKASPKNEAEFDKLHATLCKIWTDCFLSSPLGTIGKAQKIVNMSYKYLYCCSNSGKYSNYFKYCHMPLDSYTLEWFKRNVSISPKLVAGKIASWSTLENNFGNDTFRGVNGKDYYTYDFYVKKIRNYIITNSIALSPLELEFIIWPEIQDHLSAEAFLFALNPEYTDKEKADIKALEVHEKLSKISKLLKLKGY